MDLGVIHAGIEARLRQLRLDPRQPPTDPEVWQRFLRLLSADATASGEPVPPVTVPVAPLVPVPRAAPAPVEMDPVTGLPDREGVLRVLWAALVRPRGPLSLLLVRINDFKQMNDGLGRAGGDALLLEFASRLAPALRPDDVVGRVGPDEFAVVAQECDEATALQLARRVLAASDWPHEAPGGEVYVSSSVGVVTCTDETSGVDLLRNAGTALEESLRHGKGRWAVFDNALRTTVRERLLTENALHRAIRHDELDLVFQPIVRLADGIVYGLEALVRWVHDGQPVAPGDFVAVAEESRLGDQLDAWVLRRACEVAGRWPDHKVSVSVNLAAQSLRRGDLVTTVAGLLHRTRLRPSRLVLELTERTLLDDDPAVADTMRRLRTLGVRLAIDDFGTGYSALSYLRTLPVSVLKIDRSFVDDIDTDPASAAIVRAVVAMGADLGLTVVAEGVERPAQAARLAQLGGTLAQGYLFHRPLADAEVPPLLAEQAARAD